MPHPGFLAPLGWDPMSPGGTKCVLYGQATPFTKHVDLLADRRNEAPTGCLRRDTGHCSSGSRSPVRSRARWHDLDDLGSEMDAVELANFAPRGVCAHSCSPSRSHGSLAAARDGRGPPRLVADERSPVLTPPGTHQGMTRRRPAVPSRAYGLPHELALTEDRERASRKRT